MPQQLINTPTSFSLKYYKFLFCFVYMIYVSIKILRLFKYYKNFENYYNLFKFYSVIKHTNKQNSAPEHET